MPIDPRISTFNLEVFSELNWGGGMLRLEEWTRICRISNMQFHLKLVFPGFLSLSLTIEPGANSVSSLNLSSSLNLEWYIYQTDVLSGLVMLGTQRHAECQPPESGMNMCLSISGSRKKTAESMHKYQLKQALKIQVLRGKNIGNELFF